MGAIVAAGAGTMGSNRTIVGLKPIATSASSPNSAWQQSHHCGIETAEIGKGGQVRFGGSNRTIVGLKLRLIRSPSC